MTGIIINQLEALLESDSRLITKASQFSSFIFNSFENINWAGFYFFDGIKLILGPFQGNTACEMIEISNGVCGKAFSKAMVINVPDVNVFPGHISCDCNSRSELVIPLIKEGKIFGVFDIDSPICGRFSSEEKLFTVLVEIFSSHVEYSDRFSPVFAAITGDV
ncbi:MAG: GAF domain-containing protein [Deltaproteobacteria bacterium]|nr:GAF domain-containing protein [Deltaproteobacteria bacterium]